MLNDQRIYYWISVDILAEIMKVSCSKIRSMYDSILQNDCIPLKEIPINYQNSYIENYLLKDKIVDVSLLDSIKDYSISKPIHAIEVQSLFKEMKLMREAFDISQKYASSGLVTKYLRELAAQYNISYSTLVRKRKKYMNSTPLFRILSNTASKEDCQDRYRTCCLYCRDLIIYLHERPGKISGSKIFRDIKNAKPFSCSKCPYNENVKNGPHKKKDYVPVATCKRKTDTMIKPNRQDTVYAIIKNIPEQQDVLSWEGVRSWSAHYQFAPERENVKCTNELWISDHKILDIFVRTKQKEDGTWEIRRPWITAIIDSASSAMISYVLSLNPNSDCIAECFARACAFTVDTPFFGTCKFMYLDNGMDYRSNRIKGLANSENEPLYLNKEFGESGILEYFGIKIIRALPNRGRSKSIESIWGTIDDEWIRELPGYCGCRPDQRPYILKEQIKNNDLYTFEQFADYFADTIYPEYNNFSVTKESPMELYNHLPKVDTIVPNWKTLSVLKTLSYTRVIRQKGIQFNNHYYWCSELGPLVEKNKNTQYRIFAFDTPFNRNISVVKDHSYIGEAHLIEKLNVVEKNRYKVIQLAKEQQKQHKHYSKNIQQLHSLIFQTDIFDEVTRFPFVDNIRYAQTIDTQRDEKEAVDDPSIPEELKKQAEKYALHFFDIDDNTNEKGQISQSFKELGRLVRNHK